MQAANMTLKMTGALDELRGFSPAIANVAACYPAIHTICAGFAECTLAERLDMIAAAKNARNPLLCYAWFSAEEAVRTGSANCIVLGLTAVILEGGEEDLRDSIMRLAVLFHSAVLLGLDANKVFSDVAALSPNAELGAEIRNFPSRPPGSRDLPAFMVRERRRGADFVYEFIGSDLRPQKRWRWPWT
jgi:hypothetical protein